MVWSGLRHVQLDVSQYTLLGWQQDHRQKQIFNRPGVAGAVLQTPLLLIKLLTD